MALVKLRDIALVAAIVGGGYLLLRGGASALSSGGDILSGFAAGIQSGIQQLTGSTPPPGTPGAPGTPGSGTQYPGNPPFPFLPTPPGTDIPTALGIGGANLGIGAAVLGGGYATGRYILPSLAQRIAQFIRGATPTAGEATAADLAGGTGEVGFAGGGIFGIAFGGRSPFGPQGQPSTTPSPIDAIVGQVTGQPSYIFTAPPQNTGLGLAGARAGGPQGFVLAAGSGAQAGQPPTQVHNEAYWRR